MIYTKWKRPIGAFAPSGSKYSDDYVLNGRDLEKVGRINHYDEIQKSVPLTEINALLARYDNGDSSALNQNDDLLYGDITDFQGKTSSEYMEMVDKGINISSIVNTTINKNKNVVKNKNTNHTDTSSSQELEADDSDNKGDTNEPKGN